MTEIKSTVDGQPESECSTVGTPEPSPRAFAHAEDSAAPATGQKTQTHEDPAASDDGSATGALAEEDAHAPAIDVAEVGEVEEGLDTPPAPRDGGLGADSELVKTAAQRDEYLALAQRTQADFENYRKRVAREAAAAQERGVCGLAKELLPALDNLDRALGAAAQDDPLLEGVRLVRSELSAALARAGIESFSPVGEPFDPAVHEAVATAEQPPGGAQSGTVVEVYQPGYRLGASIIRPARVVVAA
jgi:molecular chaperone GrpE